MTSTEYMIELAKLKAKELYNTFHQMVEIDTTDGDGITREYPGHLLDEYKKQFAKVVVGEIIKTKEPDQWMGVGFDNNPVYWNEVKKEIDLL